jgi:hypothetical protein
MIGGHQIPYQACRGHGGMGLLLRVWVRAPQKDTQTPLQRFHDSLNIWPHG